MSCFIPGPIPARAGQPDKKSAMESHAGAYPRACGATALILLIHVIFAGLSPRVRGNPLDDGKTYDSTGPIPARAGQPLPALLTYDCDRAYPRACGATGRCAQASAGRWAYPRACGATSPGGEPGVHDPGLSPRVRGNQGYVVGHYAILGPIPARAGQPEADAARTRCPWAYPRACGATRVDAIFVRIDLGLSPRVRGNQPAHPSRHRQ